MQTTDDVVGLFAVYKSNITVILQRDYKLYLQEGSFSPLTAVCLSTVIVSICCNFISWHAAYASVNMYACMCLCVLYLFKCVAEVQMHSKPTDSKLRGWLTT